MASKALISDELPTDLPELPVSWSYSPLARLVNERGISYGIVQPGSNDAEGVPIVRVNNVKEGRIVTDDVLRVNPEIEGKYDRTRLRGGEVLLTLVGSLGECAVVSPDLAGWNVARAVGVIPVAEHIGPRWVAICLQSKPVQHYIRTWATTTVQATLNLRDVAKLPITLPPKAEREAIAHVLGTLDDKIDLNRRTNATLEALARALFQSWFVDFDPVRAKAEGRKPAGLDAATARLFPDGFEQPPLGPVPKAWKVGRLADIAENPRRGVDPSDLAPGTAYIGLEHMPRRSIALPEWGQSDELASNKFRFSKGEILFGKLRPYFQKVGVAPIDGVCSTDILVVRPTAPSWFGLLLLLVSGDDFIRYADGTSTGTKMPRTNWNDMARYEITLPPENVSARFTEIIRPMVERICTNVHESHTLAAVRDALLPKLLSGEVRVKDAAKFSAKGEA